MTALTCVICVNYGDDHMNYIINAQQKQWTQSTFLDLQSKIRQYFALAEGCKFELYENIDGNEVFIDDIDDVLAAFDDNKQNRHQKCQLINLNVYYDEHSSKHLEMDWKANIKSKLLTKAYLNGISRSCDLITKYSILTGHNTPSDIINACNSFVIGSVIILGHPYFFGYHMINNKQMYQYKWSFFADRIYGPHTLSRNSFINDIICAKTINYIGLNENEQMIIKQINDIISKSQLIGLPDWLDEDRIAEFKPILLKQNEFNNDNIIDFHDLDCNKETQLQFINNVIMQFYNIQNMIENKFDFKFADYLNIDLNLDNIKDKISFNLLTIGNIFKIKSLRYEEFIRGYDYETGPNIPECDEWEREYIVEDIQEILANDKSDKEKLIAINNKLKEGWEDLTYFNHDITVNQGVMYDIEKAEIENILTQINHLNLTESLNKELLPFFSSFTNSFIIHIQKDYAEGCGKELVFILGVMDNKDLVGMISSIN